MESTAGDDVPVRKTVGELRNGCRNRQKNDPAAKETDKSAKRMSQATRNDPPGKETDKSAKRKSQAQENTSAAKAPTEVRSECLRRKKVHLPRKIRANLKLKENVYPTQIKKKGPCCIYERI